MAKKVFGVKHLFLLRNFPIASKTCRKTDFLTSKTLKLVYVGSINKFRGILETVEYVQEFNNKYHSKKHLTLSIFSRPSDLLTPYINFSDIIQEKYLNYPELMKALRSYDVGICLWLPLKKFHRNLPIKNFDYMAAGLPVITSNFGNLKKYIDLSGAGIAIDPNSYEEFENAINMMFDHNNRKLFSDNGRLYIENEGNFEKESVPYVRMYSNSEKY
ncbi:MAG: glycosyltransferase [Synergistales bacterium]|nr:glycosyltransferase [Synergistales bacterium]